ncbi:MAG: TlpA family protein disulfide reductase [Bacteroidaceae bacterium]|nr:TlpA family protein disulfide reductase [Bacteroidaceae bacterium]
MRYYVNWFFVVLLISSLTSFIEKDRPVEGLSIGEYAPDFVMSGDDFDAANAVHSKLSTLHGNYVLVNFWASYDAPSRMRNIELNRALLDDEYSRKQVEFVSVSFDDYASIFRETVRKDGIVGAGCFVDTDGAKSSIFKDYKLKKGFTNYLLDENGMIIAKNISVAELSSYLNARHS